MKGKISHKERAIILEYLTRHICLFLRRVQIAHVGLSFDIVDLIHTVRLSALCLVFFLEELLYASLLAISV